MSEENYIGEDGLLYCGVCHEPKEALWETGEAVFGSDRHPCPCRCERERQAKLDQELREINHRHRIAELRRSCFAYSAMYGWTFANASIQTERLEQCRRYAENWSAEQVAAVLGISRSNAYALMRQEDFPTLHIGKRMLVPKDRLIQWIEASTQK